MTTDTETYDDLIKELPGRARTAVAQARNRKARVAQHREAMLTESAAFRASVRSLHYTHGLSLVKIGKLLDISRTRVTQLIQQKKR